MSRKDAEGTGAGEGKRSVRPERAGAQAGARERAWRHPVPANRGSRALVYVLLVALGVLTAIAGGLVQSGWFPGGLILALTAAVGVFWGGGKLCRTRLGAVAPGVGWVLTVLLLTSPRPEGDFLFGAGLGSYVFLLGGMLAAVMCATIALPAPPMPERNFR